MNKITIRDGTGVRGWILVCHRQRFSSSAPTWETLPVHITPRYIRSDRREMQRFITTAPATSLEVGCREALFSKRLSERFPSVETWGIDPDESIHEQARTNLHHAFCGLFPLEPAHYQGRTFDLIVFNDVLEHVYDPWAAVAACKDILAPGGIIVASLPNMRHKPILRDLILHDRFTYTDSGNLDVSHIRFFTRTSMRLLFEDAGFSVSRIEPVNPITNPFKRLWIHLSRGWAESFYAPQYALVAGWPDPSDTPSE